MKSIRYFAMIFFLPTACVSSATHRALLTKHEKQDVEKEKLNDQLSDEIQRLQTEIKLLGFQVIQRDKLLEALQFKLTRIGDDLASLQRQIPHKEKEIKSLQTARRRLKNDLDEILRDRNELQAMAQDMKRAMQEMAKRKAESERRVADYRNLLRRFKSLIDSGNLRVKISDGRMVLELPSDVLFASGSAKLSRDGKQTILAVGEVLIMIPERRFQVEGHTDNVPIHTDRFPSNWQLASARSQVVVDALIESGMNPEQISAASFGEFRPVADNAEPASKAMNRRIEIVIVPDLSLLPGHEELKEAVAGE